MPIKCLPGRPVELVFLWLCVSGAAAQTSPSDCKQEIVAILAGLEALPAHEETKNTITETRKTAKGPYHGVSSKKSVVLRVPPDRFRVTLWKQDELRLESVSIGNRTWSREPGEEWQFEPPTQPGSPGYFVEDIAARIAEVGKALYAQIEQPACHGLVSHGGRRTLHYSYRMLFSKAQLWTDMETRYPIEERLISEISQLNARTTTIRTFRYDDALIVEIPK